MDIFNKYDVLIVGGGINGAAIAADAAGRGLSVLLVEAQDFAAGTSSASSKLIHGGLRYLEQYHFSLVRESLRERRILLNRAPHLVYPLTFIMPDNRACHAPWFIRLGLYLYDVLAYDNHLPRAQRVNLATLPLARMMQTPAKGFSYSDCWGDDARLVIANLRLAQQHGATILPRTALVSASCNGKIWQATLAGYAQPVEARCIINATGPWADSVNARIFTGHTPHPHLHLVKGSHLVVKKFYPGEMAFVLQHEDGRIIFVIPYQQDFCIVGTTDVFYTGDPAQVHIDEAEEVYLRQVIARYFRVDLTPEQIIWRYSGVRPLYEAKLKPGNPAKISRDFFIAKDQSYPEAPVITVYGGKLTTHRALAERVLQLLQVNFPHMKSAWTHNAPLPGGQLQIEDKAVNFAQFFAHCQQKFAWMPPIMLHRLVRAYGAEIDTLLAACHAMSDLGHHFGGTLYAREVDYLRQYEWAQTAEDILWRRTKQGLYLSASEQAYLAKA